MSQSLKKGIEALLFLASRKSVGVTELAQALDINKSTAFRILDTFLEANMVEKAKHTQKYKLGPAILKLSEQYYKNYSVIDAAKPLMDRLAVEIRESVHLCVCANSKAVVIEQTMSDSRLVVNAKIGDIEPLYCSAVGKCLVAFALEEDRAKMLSGITYEAHTDKTICSAEEFNSELERVRAQGWAIDNGELSEHVRCVAVPILDEKGTCRYSLGASGAMSRMTQEKIERIIPLMLKTAASIIN
ncbi:MAG: IclR family transcriptional regulator [Firmicutes bacterium HGW-Firmicutes-16]|nr:MAG: IclR family transcriptional regulator [Firmicutes bacterium HGW-Firmicutes-16]